MFLQKPNPKKDTFTNKLSTSIQVTEIAKAQGLSPKYIPAFRQAIYYINILYSNFAEPEDISQIYHAIAQIEAEEIHNVPIMDLNNNQSPIQVLKAKAALMLIKVSIIGLKDSEIELLRRLLSSELTYTELEPANLVIDKLKQNPVKAVCFPADINTLNQFWQFNKNRLIDA